ncbi:MAG: FAD-binding oxidoreductase [Archaeoglobi archaeon]|nr:FAD-binding oxidoreductase [Candidatus Mnemosynella bozhongmuii]
MKIIERLEEIVGTGNIISEYEDLFAYSIDAAPGKFVIPQAVVKVHERDEVSEILKLCDETGTPVVCRGAGSSITGAPTPVEGGIVLDFTEMNRIKEVEEKKMCVTVEPGVVYARLNEFLSQSNLFFPPDPGSAEVCTIGGMVSNNASGMRAVKYGTTENYVRVLEVVLPGGKIFRIGKKVVKSSAGYDLRKLFIGSEGTLGAITEITLSLRALPKYRRTFFAYFDDVGRAAKSVTEIILSGVIPAAMEFLDDVILETIVRSGKKELKVTDAALLIEYDGFFEENVVRECNVAVEICRKNGAEIIYAESDEERERIWEIRRMAYPLLVQRCVSPITGDVIVPIENFEEAITSFKKMAEEMGVPTSFLGHSGDGNIHPIILADERDEELWKRALELNERIIKKAVSLGGSITAEHGVGYDKNRFLKLEWGESLEIYRRIKRILDPNNIMNPGKMIA